MNKQQAIEKAKEIAQLSHEAANVVDGEKPYPRAWVKVKGKEYHGYYLDGTPPKAYVKYFQGKNEVHAINQWGKLLKTIKFEGV